MTKSSNVFKHRAIRAIMLAFIIIWVVCCLFACCRAVTKHEWNDPKTNVQHTVSIEYWRLFGQNLKGLEISDPSGLKITLESQESKAESLKALIDTVGPTVAPTLLKLLEAGVI